MNKKLKNHNSGLTLAELLVALMVASIIFTAVASFTYAMSSANDSSEDVSFKQAQIRHAAVRISELLKNSKLITLTASGEDLAVWRADDNNNNKIDPSELVFIEVGPNRDYIWLLEFPGAPDWFDGGGIPLEEITAGEAKTSLSFGFASYVRRAKLIEQCSNVKFSPDTINVLSRFASISFDIKEGGQDRNYQISAALRCWAGHLLNSDGSSLVSEDD